MINDERNKWMQEGCNYVKMFDELPNGHVLEFNGKLAASA